MTERHEGPLTFELQRPRGDSTEQERTSDTTVALLLHGRGSDERDLQGLAPLLPPDWTVVTPRGPHAGAPWGYGPGWAWYRYEAEDRVVESTLAASLEALDRLLADLPDRLDFEPRQVVLGGFSQGGTTSLAYALSRPRAVAAAINFSGFLSATVDLTHAHAAPPIFWGHGRKDPSIPFTLALRGRERLIEAGAKLVTRDYDIGHWILPEEVAAAVEMVRGA